MIADLRSTSDICCYLRCNHLIFGEALRIGDVQDATEALTEPAEGFDDADVEPLGAPPRGDMGGVGRWGMAAVPCPWRDDRDDQPWWDTTVVGYKLVASHGQGTVHHAYPSVAVNDENDYIHYCLIKKILTDNHLITNHISTTKLSRSN